MKPWHEGTGVRIFQGDCLDVLAALDAESVDLVIADPPYNVGFRYRTYRDLLPEEGYHDWQVAVVAACERVLKPGGSLWWLNYPEKAALLWTEFVRRAGDLEPVDWLTWVYQTNLDGRYLRKAHRAWLWFAKGEPTLVGKFTGIYRNPTDRRVRRLIEQGEAPTAIDWWECDQVKQQSAEKTEHPCQIPEALVRRILQPFPPGIVLDPFLGSGTTLRAALDLGHEGIGIELDPYYCEIARGRLAQGVLPLEVA